MAMIPRDGQSRPRPAARTLAALVCLPLAAGCGGGGGGGNPAGGSGSQGSDWTPGLFLPSVSFANECANPRTGIDPRSGSPWPDVQGTVLDENNFLRSYSDETYLWYDEIVDQDPGLFDDPHTYFDELKTSATTPSGNDKDRFHFTYPTEEWIALSQSGVSVDYGAAWVILDSTPPDREIVIAYVEPDSPASAPGVDLARGARILQVDGVDVADGPAGPLTAGLFPAAAGESHSFTVEDAGGGGVTRVVQMTAEAVVAQPVHNVTTLASPMGTVGYLTFNDHSAIAETALIEAVEALAGVDELILDIRYNGGGFLAIASQLAYMIAGEANTAGRTFELMRFNDKHPSTNPVTGAPLQPTPFYNTTLGSPFPEPPGQPLPSLDLGRVFVLTGPNTCSASEAVVNALRGIGVEVVQVGATTCGKPYGFYPEDNCGTTWFTIQFQGVNDQGFGDYPDGFSPSTAPALATDLPGCAVADDFTHPLGDPLERRLEAALHYLETGACPPAQARAPGDAGTSRLAAADGHMPKPPWRENRIVSPLP